MAKKKLKFYSNKISLSGSMYKLHAKETQKCMRHAMIPKYILTPNFGIPTSNYIQICSGLDLARTEARGQGHVDLEPVGDSPGPKMYLHTKWGTATINNIGDLLWVHFFKT